MNKELIFCAAAAGRGDPPLTLKIELLHDGGGRPPPSKKGTATAATAASGGGHPVRVTLEK